VAIAKRDLVACVRRLYRGVDGFGIARAEEKKVRAAKSSPTYGEIEPTAALALFDALAPTADDVFYDLGCGLGKVSLLAVMATPVRKSVGIELAADRIARARAVARVAARQGLFARRRLVYREQNLLDAPLRDATILYTCSTAFPDAFMRRLARKVAGLKRSLRFATLQVLDDHPAFVEREVLRLDMTWRRGSKVYVYDVNGGRGSR
jgi:SAM-dependent methyltransferase